MAHHHLKYFFFHDKAIADLYVHLQIFIPKLNMAPRDQTEESAPVKGKVAKMSTKKSPTEEKTSSSNLTLKDMVIEAIVVQKEKSGSSLDAIKKFLGSKHQMDTVKQAGRLNRYLNKASSVF